MAASQEDWIKHRAYQLWEQEGYPAGKDMEHWERAKLEYATLKPTASVPAAKKASTKAEKPAAAKSTKTASQKTATKAPAKAAAKKTDKPAAKAEPKTEKVPAVAAAVTADQTKKRSKKLAAE
ncbi:hypothetical protein NCHU2750_30280 [Neorhizobium sp. NCHU2750]|nr:hypothetical protein NCHU2750_30280 [Neorhizobium sp. NCHU2750]